MSNILHVDFKAAAVKPLKTFKNPDIKVEIPVDFPEIGDQYDSTFKTIREGLRRLNVHLGQPGLEINIAYPHKHPGLHPHHQKTAQANAESLFRDLQRCPDFSHIKFRIAHEICERVKLSRSWQQGVVHALTGRQIYDVNLASQDDAPTYLLPKEPGDQRNDLFIVIDHMSEQGTTLTNLMSYIHHNGGQVVAAIVAGSKAPLKQQATKQMQKTLSSRFNDAARNTGRLEEMARHFADCERVAGRQASPQQCMEAFEQVLNACGNTVFALTDVECERVIDKPYAGLLLELEDIATRPQEKPKQACLT